MYTANTMAAAGEALGMSLPGSASPPAVDYRREVFARESGLALTKLLASGLRPRDILTKDAFTNAIAVVMALAGSTNAVLHLLAIAHEAGVELELDDFDRISRSVPHLVDVRPAGRFVMQDLDRVGGVPVVMKELLDAGLLNGDAITVTGKTIAQNLEELAPQAPDGSIVRPFSEPIHPEGGTAILYGSLAPEGSVMKIAGAASLEFHGRARPFDSEQEAFDAVTSGSIVAGDVIVIRYEGPKGSPGMPEMLAVTAAVSGVGLGAEVGPDHRRAVQRRLEGLQRRARLARGVRGRSHRARARGRRDRDRRREPPDRSPGRRRRARTAARRVAGSRTALRERRAREVREARRLGLRGRRHLVTPSR